MPIFRSLALVFVSLVTFAASTVSPVPAAAIEPSADIPVDQVVAAIDDVLDRMAGELTEQVQAAGNVPLAGAELDQVLKPITDDIKEARTFLTTWIVPTAETGDDSRAELFLEGALWVLFGPEDALDHPDLDPVVRDALRDVDVPGLGLDLILGADGATPKPGDVALTVTLGADAIGVDVMFAIGQSVELMVPAEFDLGLSVDDATTTPYVPNFGVDLRLLSGLDVELSWDAVIHVGVDVPIGTGSSAAGPYIGGSSRLGAKAEVSIAPGPANSSGLDGRVALGLLQTEFSDGVTREDTNDFERSSLTVEAALEIGGDDKVYLARITPDSLEASLSVKGQLRLQVRASVDHLTDALNSAIDAGEFVVGVPSLNFSLIADPEFSVGIGSDGVGGDAGLDEIRFENITIDMREFLRGVMVPMARSVAQLTAPVNEALGLDSLSQQQKDGILNEPLPVISELAGEDQSLRSLGLDEEFEDLVEALTAISNFGDDVKTYIDSPQFVTDIGNGGQVPLPCLVAVLDKKSVLNITKIRRPALCLERKIESELSDFDPKVSVNVSISPSVFKFDLLSTQSFYKLLLGEPVDIVSVGLPEVSATATAQPSIDLEVIEIDIDVNAHAEVGLRLVYDSTGIEALVDQLSAGQELDLSVLADGFYLQNRPGACATAEELAKPFADREHGCEIGVGAGFEGRLQIGPDELNAWGEVDIAGELGLQVLDPDDDGKLRGNELAALTNDWANPENLFCLFDLRGAGKLYAAAGLVSPLGDTSASLPNVSGDFSLLELLGTEFDICSGSNKPTATALTPILASVSSGSAGDTLLIHTGDYAALRRAGDVVDDRPLTIDVTGGRSSLTVQVKADAATERAVLPIVPNSGEPEPTLSDRPAFDFTQTFAGNFVKIMISGGSEADTITVAPAIATDVRSNAGDDEVTTGDGPDMVDAGSGDDDVTTNGGDDDIDSGRGADTVNAGEDTDIIRGGPGINTLIGGPGPDLIIGGPEQDTIDAGPGEDEVEGRGGDDKIDGGPDGDVIDGGAGNDDIDSGGGDDMVEGGIGDDSVFAAGGADSVDTGPGDDFVGGDASRGATTCSELVSAAGPGGDMITTGSGDDIVVPGPGNDTVSTGLGDDCVFSSAGRDGIDVGAGTDKVAMASIDRLRGRVDQNGAVAERSGDRSEIDGSEMFELVGGVTTIADLNEPAEITVRSGARLNLEETDSDLKVLDGVSFQIVATRASNGPVAFSGISENRISVDGHGNGTIELPLGFLGYTGTDGPDEVEIGPGVDVAVDGRAGSDTTTLIAAGLDGFDPIESTFQGSEGRDTLRLNLGPMPGGLIGLFPPVDLSPFDSVEEVEVISEVSDGILGWDDGVLTANGSPLVNIASADKVRLPDGLASTFIDASDSGGRNVSVLGDTVTVEGARAIPAFVPNDPRSFNEGDEIGVLEPDGTLQIFRANANAEKLAERSLLVSDVMAVAAADVYSDALDDIFTFAVDRTSVSSYTEDGELSELFRSRRANVDFQERIATVGTDADGEPMVLAVSVANSRLFCIIERFREVGSNLNFSPDKQDAYSCPLDTPVLPGTSVIPTRFDGGRVALHQRDGLRSSVTFLDLGPSVGLVFPRTEPTVGRTIVSSVFDGPTTGISCSHGDRLVTGAGLETLRLKETGGGLVGATSATTPSKVESVEELNGRQVLLRLANGQVHIDDFCSRSAGRSSIDTGISLGADDLVFAGNLFRDTPPQPPEVFSEPNLSVTPVMITSPRTSGFVLSTGAAVDSYVIGDTEAQIFIDSGPEGDLINVDLATRPGQIVEVKSGPGNDQVGIRIDGPIGSARIETGPGTDRVDLFKAPDRGTLELSGQEEADVLRIHPEDRGVRFLGGSVPRTPDDEVFVGSFAGVPYSGFEEVLINTGPTVVLAAPPFPVFEGDIVPFDTVGSFSPDGQDLTFAWDLNGDGVFGEGTGPSQVIFNPDDGPLRAGVRATDTAGRSAERSVLVSVANRSPEVSFIVPPIITTTGFESFAFVEELLPVPIDTVSEVAIDWGDGSPVESFAPGTASHVYAAPGTYPVTLVSVTDEDGTFPASEFATGEAIVQDPKLSVRGAAQEIESAPYRLELVGDDSAPPIETWIIDWSDGQNDVVPGGVGSIDRFFDGPDTVTAEVTALFEGGVEFALPPHTFNVIDVPPEFVGFVPLEADEGPVTFSLASFDPGLDSIQSWRIDWGDGSADTVPALVDAPTHRYRPGTYRVLVAATNEDGTFPLVEQNLVVENLLPIIEAVEVGEAIEGGAVQIMVTATDLDPTGLRFTFLAPGATEPEVMSLDGQATLTFPDDGQRSVTVQVSDQFGGTASDSVTVDVKNASPAASIRFAGTKGRILEGEDVEVTVEAIDRGDDTPTSALLDWGDGSPQESIALGTDGRGTATHRYIDGGATVRRAMPENGVFVLDGVEVNEDAFVVDGTPRVVRLLNVIDEDGTHPADDEIVTEVVDVPPTAVARIAIVAGEYRLTVDRISDPGDDTIVEHLIDWGDGATDRFSGAPSDGQVFTHPVGTERNPIQLGLIDEDGSHIAASFTVAELTKEPISLQVRARGATGQEVMVVSVGGRTIDFPVSKDFELYNIDLDITDPASIGLVKVAFVNDFYRRGVIDRNLFVDHIVVRQGEVRTVYETEAPEVFSTGVYLSGVGCGGRFARSEKMSCNGEFRFDLPTTGDPDPDPDPKPDPDPVIVQVRARGDVGGERMEVSINGKINGFDVSDEFKLYPVELAPGTKIDDLRVQFTNDLYIPRVVDRNLIVDFVRVDDTVYQTEDPSVVSTGVYVSGEGCLKRNAESEQLWCDGEFRYIVGSDPNPDPGADPIEVEVRARGDEGGETMVVEVNGSAEQFTVSRDFELYAIELPDGQSLESAKVSFTNDRYIQGVIDRNLVVDWIRSEGRTYQTEDPSTFSTGSYTPTLKCLPGFARSERLNCRGSFTFDID